MEELQRQSGWGTSFGLPIELISAEDAQRRFPIMTLEDVRGAAYLATDGYLDPSGLTLALAEGARRGGARICEGVRVSGLRIAAGGILGVETDAGSIESEVVVNAAGIYAPEIARMAGVTVPIIPMAHQYLVARIRETLPEDLPTMRDPDRLVYFRRDAAGLVMGGYERDPAPFGLRGIASDFNNRLLPEDWPRFEPLSEQAVTRVSGAGPRRRREADQWAGGLHARQRVRAWRIERARILCRSRLLCPRHRRRRWDGQGDGAVGSSMASRNSTSGRWTCGDSAASIEARPIRWRAPTRSTPPTTTFTTRTRSGAPGVRCGSPPPTHD